MGDFILDVLSFIAMGFLIGMLVGSTGMGGGAITTPLLILVAGVRPIVAVGTDLVFAMVTKVAGAFQHTRQRTVNFTMVKFLALGSVPGALIGAVALQIMDVQYAGVADKFVVTLLGVLLITVGVLVLYRILLTKERESELREGIEWDSWTKRKTVLLGLMTGFLVSMTSVGSGTIIVVCLILFYTMLPKNIVGTDVLHGAILVGTAASFKVGLGNVDYGIAAFLIIGSIPGVLIGSKLCSKIRPALLKQILAVILVLVGITMLYQTLFS